MDVKLISPSSVKPAAYNPRSISKEEFAHLCDSIRRYGFVLPILVNSGNNTIVAGHQRTKAALKIGLTQIPAMYVSGLSTADEIKYNQLHNGVARDGAGNCRATGEGFCSVDPDMFHIFWYAATYVKEICNILTKYGNTLSCVVCSGTVVAGYDYIKACQLLGLPVNCFMSADDADEVHDVLSDEYGSFSYAHLPKHTYVQGLAQLQRLSNGRQMKSALYENHVIPWLQENWSATVLDFGAGKCEYARRLGKNYAIDPLEFYPNNRHQILVDDANSMINAVLHRVQDNGLYDAVILDSVLNSVDCMEAQSAVLACCNAFLKKGGQLFVSGRPVDAAREKYNLRIDRNVSKRFIEFLDGDNFTANYRAGNWYYQHYHDQETVMDILEEQGFAVERICWRKCGDSWQAVCQKKYSLPWDSLRKGIEYEFNLPLPGGRSFSRDQETADVLQKIYYGKH